VKNPNYWGYDERHPKNKIPYIDGVKILIIPALNCSGLRYAQAKSTYALQVQYRNAQAMAQTNPEIKQITHPRDSSSKQ